MARFTKVTEVPKVMGKDDLDIVAKIMSQLVKDFDSTLAYNEGDYALYKGNIYKAIAIVTPGGNFVESNWKKLTTAEEFTSLLISKGQAGAVTAEDSKLLGGKPRDYFASKESLEGMYEGQAIRDLLVRSRPLFRFPSFRETNGMREYSNNGHPIISMAIQHSLSTIQCDVNLKKIDPTAPLEDLDNVTLRMAPKGSTLSGRIVLVKEGEWLKPDTRYLVHVTAKLPTGVTMGLYQSELGTDREIVYYGNTKGINKYKSYYIYFKTGGDSIPHAQVKLQIEGTFQPSQVAEIRYIQAFDLDGTNASFVTWMKVLETMQCSMPMIMNPAMFGLKPGDVTVIHTGKSPCTMIMKPTKQYKAAMIPTFLDSGASKRLAGHNSDELITDGYGVDGQAAEITFTENASPLSNRYVIIDIENMAKAKYLDLNDENFTNYGVVVFKIIASIPKNARLAIFDQGKPLPDERNDYRIVDHLGGRGDGRGSGFAETYYIVAESKHGANNATQHDFKIGFVDFRSGTTATIYYIQQYWSVFPRDSYMYSRFLTSGSGNSGSSTGAASSANALNVHSNGNVNMVNGYNMQNGGIITINKGVSSTFPIRGISFYNGQDQLAEITAADFTDHTGKLDDKYLIKKTIRDTVTDMNAQFKANQVIGIDKVTENSTVSNKPNVVSSLTGGAVISGIRGTLMTLNDNNGAVGGQIYMTNDNKGISELLFRNKGETVMLPWKQVLTWDDITNAVPSKAEFDSLKNNSVTRSEFESLKQSSVNGKRGLVDRYRTIQASMGNPSGMPILTENSSLSDFGDAWAKTFYEKPILNNTLAGRFIYPLTMNGRMNTSGMAYVNRIFLVGRNGFPDSFDGSNLLTRFDQCPSNMDFKVYNVKKHNAFNNVKLYRHASSGGEPIEDQRVVFEYMGTSLGGQVDRTYSNSIAMRSSGNRTNVGNFTIMLEIKLSKDLLDEIKKYFGTDDAVFTLFTVMQIPKESSSYNIPMNTNTKTFYKKSSGYENYMDSELSATAISGMSNHAHFSTNSPAIKALMLGQLTNHQPLQNVLADAYPAKLVASNETARVTEILLNGYRTYTSDSRSYEIHFTKLNSYRVGNFYGSQDGFTIIHRIESQSTSTPHTSYTGPIIEMIYLMVYAIR